MPCIYGACAYLVQNTMLTELQAIERNATHYDKMDVLRALGYWCPVLSDDEKEAIYATLLAKQFIIEKNGHTYCGIRMMANRPLMV